MNIENRIDYNNFEEVKEKLNFKIVNLESNIYRLTSHEIPYEALGNYDLAYYICITQEIENGAMNTLASHSLLKTWHKSYNDIYEIAAKNFRKQKTKIISISGMTVLTNESKLNGAVRIFDRQALREVVNHDLTYLIPSSIHEWILQPMSDYTSDEDINNMIKDINEAIVDPNDVLSNKLYAYNREQDEFYQYQYDKKSWLKIRMPDLSKVIL